MIWIIFGLIVWLGCELGRTFVIAEKLRDLDVPMERIRGNEDNSTN